MLPRSSSPPLLPPRYQLRWARLGELMTGTWTRDALRNAAAPMNRWSVAAGRPLQTNIEGVGQRAGLRVLMSLLMWRSQLFPEEGFPELTRDEADRFAKSVAEAMEILLRPWLEDEAPVDHGVLARILRWGNEGLGIKRVRKPRKP